MLRDIAKDIRFNIAEQGQKIQDNTEEMAKNVGILKSANEKLQEANQRQRQSNKSAMWCIVFIAVLAIIVGLTVVFTHKQ